MLHNTDRFWFYIFQDETQEMIALFLSYHYIFIIYWCCVFHDKFDAQPSCSTTWDLAHMIHATSHLLHDLCKKTMTLMMGMMMMALTMTRIAMTMLLMMMMTMTMTRCQGWRCPRCFWAEDMFPFTDLARHLTSMTHNHWLLSDTNNFRTLPRAGCLLFHNLCTFVLEWFGNGESLCVKISWTRIPKITFEYSFRLAPIEIH